MIINLLLQLPIVSTIFVNLPSYKLNHLRHWYSHSDISPIPVVRCPSQCRPSILFKYYKIIIIAFHFLNLNPNPNNANFPFSHYKRNSGHTFGGFSNGK